jgi:hypothetical protein
VAAAGARGRGGIDNLDGWLTTVVGRLALDRLRSARARRETYGGPWLPEPLVSDDPADRVTLDESVSYALLTVLEQLSPAARTPLRGGSRVARAWAALSRRYVREPIEIDLNGRLGLVVASGDGHRAELSFVVGDGRITRIDAIRNPEKLRRL